MTNYITIEIQYLSQQNKELQSFFLSPEEYFDLEENEVIDLDSCPKFNHALEYINKEKFNGNKLREDLLFTKLLLTDLKNKQHKQITERFWHHGENKIIERIDIDLNTFQVSFNEIIIETLISEQPPKWEIIRLNKEGGIMQPLFHSFIEEGENGEQLEIEKIIESFPSPKYFFINP